MQEIINDKNIRSLHQALKDEIATREALQRDVENVKKQNVQIREEMNNLKTQLISMMVNRR